MAGATTHYAVEPRGEYVFGVVRGAAMRSRRGPERRLVRPGQLVAWDPSAAHAGAAVDGRPWRAQLMVIEAPDLGALARDEEEQPLPADLVLSQPVLDDCELAVAFEAMHAALRSDDLRLRRDELASEWLRLLVERAVPGPSPRPAPADARAFRAACAYLAEHADRNVGLDELAAAAGTGKFRLIRTFRARTGLPPHATHLAHRVRRARRLIEDGEDLAAVAAATGFSDQSHLHRHFRRALGFTPGAYRRAMAQRS